MIFRSPWQISKMSNRRSFEKKKTTKKKKKKKKLQSPIPKQHFYDISFNSLQYFVFYLKMMVKSIYFIWTASSQYDYHSNKFNSIIIIELVCTFSAVTLQGPCHAKRYLRACAKCADSDSPAHAQSKFQAFSLYSYILWYLMIC